MNGFAQPAVQSGLTVAMAVGSPKMMLMRDAAVCVVMSRRLFALHSWLDMCVCFADRDIQHTPMFTLLHRGSLITDAVYVGDLWQIMYSR